MPHITLAAETLWTVMGLPITNSLLSTWIVMAFLFIFAFFVSTNLKNRPSILQVIAELIIGGLYDFFTSVGGKHAKSVFPILASIFLFVIIANWSGLLPGVGTIGFFHAAPVSHSETTEVSHTEEAQSSSASESTHEPVADTHAVADVQVVVEEQAAPVDTHAAPVAESETEAESAHHGPAFTPLFRSPTADLNMTIALALVAVVMVQVIGFKRQGIRYARRFFDISNPILFFVGILELISEFSKIISFGFRLFGNVFAGEVLLVVIAFLIPFIAPMPFLFLEIFVGFIQALVFSMLTIVFLVVALAHGEHAEHGSVEGEAHQGSTH